MYTITYPHNILEVGLIANFFFLVLFFVWFYHIDSINKLKYKKSYTSMLFSFPSSHKSLHYPS